MKVLIKVENSAPSQKIPAKSIGIVSEFLNKINIDNVVYFGCGRLRNLPILSRCFKKILLVDTHLQCERITASNININGFKLLSDSDFCRLKERFSAVFLILVLHTLPDMKKRIEVLKYIEKKINNGGFLVVDVPTGEKYYRRICNNENKYNDGWILGKGSSKTFYKQFKAVELDEFIQSNTNMVIFRKISIKNHLVRIYIKEIKG